MPAESPPEKKSSSVTTKSCGQIPCASSRNARLSGRHSLLQNKHGIDVRRYGHVLWREFFCRSNIRRHRHGSGSSTHGGEDANVLEGIHRSVRQFAKRSAARCCQRWGGGANPPVGISDGFALSVFGG